MQQFIRFKRLGQILVRAQFQTIDSVLDSSKTSHHDDWNFLLLIDNRLQDLHSIESW